MNRATGLWLGEAVHFVKKVKSRLMKLTMSASRWLYRCHHLYSLFYGLACHWSGIEEIFHESLQDFEKQAKVNLMTHVGTDHAGGDGEDGISFG